MSSYVNPQNGLSKETWLKNNCSSGPLSAIRPWESELYKEQLPVCLVDNGPFTAAGITYSEHEFNDFNNPHDHRSKEWYIVPISRLFQVSDLHRYIKVDEVVEDATTETSIGTSYYNQSIASQVAETAIDTMAAFLVVDVVSEVLSSVADSIESVFD